MPSSPIESWIERIDQRDIPIFQATVHSIAQIAAKDETSASELAGTILRDPSMAARILKLANSPFYRPKGSTVINTVSHAVVLLGFEVIQELSLSLAVIDSLLAKENRGRLARLLATSLHSAVQARSLAERRGFRNLEEIFIAALLFDLGELSFWCVATKEEIRRYEAALRRKDRSPEEAQEEVFGFRFRDLTCQLVRKWEIRSTLEEILKDEALSRPVSRIVHHGKELAAIAISKREDKENIKKIKEIADFMQWEHPVLKKLMLDNLQMAIETAETYHPVIVHCFFADSGSASAPELEEAEVVVRYPEPDPLLQLKILRELSTMLQTSSDLNIVLEALLEGVYRGVGMDRALFALYSSFRSQVKAKFVLGSTGDFLMDHFSFPVGSDPDNPFADILFTRQEGIWVRNVRSTSYDQRIMYRIKTTLDVDSFFLTPIIANRCAIGIFYADRQLSKRPLDENSFASFEHFGQQACISLEYLSHKGRK